MNLFRWIKHTLIIAVLAAIIGASHLYLDQPLHLQYGEWQASPSVVVAAAAVIVAVVLLALALKLLSLVLFFPMHMVKWNKERARKNRAANLEAGARALVLDDYRQALKVFSQLAGQSDPDGVCAWLAAEAAEKSGDSGKREQWLRRAAADASEDVAAAAKATLAADESRDSEAFLILTEAGAPYGSPLLARMYLETALRLGKWSQAIAAAYRLRDHARAQKWQKAAGEIAETALKNIADIESLHEFWKNNLSSEDRKNPALESEYIYALHRLGNKSAMSDALERAVKTSPGSAAMLKAAAALGSDKLCESAFAAAQKNENKNDDANLQAIAMLAERLKLWGRARKYYQMANSLRPDPRNITALEELDAKMKSDQERAASPSSD